MSSRTPCQCHEMPPPAALRLDDVLTCAESARIQQSLVTDDWSWVPELEDIEDQHGTPKRAA